ncbi:hypothetical protein HRbin10_01484 [bacterium HR10]|nr:hypothetical protein HRbin10_01484 [bacterium HR10]
MASALSVVHLMVGQGSLRSGDFAQLWGLSPRGEERDETRERAREMKKFLSDQGFSAFGRKTFVFAAWRLLSLLHWVRSRWSHSLTYGRGSLQPSEQGIVHERGAV